MFKRLYLC